MKTSPPTRPQRPYHRELPTGQTYAVAIVATPSGPRAAAVETMLAACEVGGLILEKVLFTRLQGL